MSTPSEPHIKKIFNDAASAASNSFAEFTSRVKDELILEQRVI